MGDINNPLSSEARKVIRIIFDETSKKNRYISLYKLYLLSELSVAQIYAAIKELLQHNFIQKYNNSIKLSKEEISIIIVNYSSFFNKNNQFWKKDNDFKRKIDNNMKDSLLSLNDQ